MTLVSEIDKRKTQKLALDTDAAESSTDVDINRGYAIIVALGLMIVHGTLATVFQAQYGQAMELRQIVKDSLPAFPVFTLLVYLCHPIKSNLSQLAGFTASTSCGCYIVYLANTEGYYASMSKVPAIGTLWIWLFIELDWYFGLVTLGIVGLYTYINDFSLL